MKLRSEISSHAQTVDQSRAISTLAQQQRAKNDEYQLKIEHLTVGKLQSRSDFIHSPPFSSTGRDAKTEQGNQREIKHAKRSGRRISADMQRPRNSVTRSDSKTWREPATIGHCGSMAKSCIQGKLYHFLLSSIFIFSRRWSKQIIQKPVSTQK